ncbi:MAG TPA: hypothetical protein VIL78_05920 [Hanamia sp.]
MKTISIKTFNIISVLIVGFYLLVLLSFLLNSCEKKYALSTKVKLTAKEIMMNNTIGNFKSSKVVFTKNSISPFCKNIRSLNILEDAGMFVNDRNNSKVSSEILQNTLPILMIFT